ncbi:hypothetical protein V8E53_008804 [Lactarius tabidus]
MCIVAIKDAHAWSCAALFIESHFRRMNYCYRGASSACGLEPPENTIRYMAIKYSAYTISVSYGTFTFRSATPGASQPPASSPPRSLHFRMTRARISWRGAVYLARGRREAVLPSLVRACLLAEASRMFLYSVWGQVVVPSCCAAVGVFNVLLIMGVNLVGFVLGVDGARYFALELINGWAGVRFLLGVCACLFIGVINAVFRSYH